MSDSQPDGLEEVCLQEKTTFIMDWGMFVALVMMFGLQTTIVTFQRIIAEIFGEYIPSFM